MQDSNYVSIVGSLVRPPEFKRTPAGVSVCEFWVTSERKWTTIDGIKHSTTLHIGCQAFGHPANSLRRHGTAGTRIMVEGWLEFQAWTAQDGSQRSRHCVHCSALGFLSGTDLRNRVETSQAGRHLQQV